MYVCTYVLAWARVSCTRLVCLYVGTEDATSGLKTGNLFSFNVQALASAKERNKQLLFTGFRRSTGLSMTLGIFSLSLEQGHQKRVLNYLYYDILAADFLVKKSLKKRYSEFKNDKGSVSRV